MKLAVSNIAWTDNSDLEMYQFLKMKGIKGLEIAPTRILKDRPYEKLEDAVLLKNELVKKYGLVIPSMQSIWYGRTENIFASAEERRVLLEYTKKAIDFAAAIGCGNLVFGCPRNRSYNWGTDIHVAVPFFEELGEYAKGRNTVLSMEANPVIYNTNFCNTTLEAVELVKEVASEGFRVNLDIGTMIYNDEKADILHLAGEWINHIHVSEPNLLMVQRRPMHRELARYLRETGYNGFVSLEVKTQDNIETVKEAVNYFQEVFT